MILPVFTPHVDVVLRIFVYTLSINCSSFFILNKVKNNLWSTMEQYRCSAISVLRIEVEITTPLDFQEIIDNFDISKSRKNFFFILLFFFFYFY